MPEKTITLQWLPVRSQVAAVDSSGSYDAVGTPATDRIVSRMVDGSDVAIAVLDVSTMNAAEFRAHFNTDGATATYHIFAAREGETSVKHVASVALVAGTQKTAGGRFFAKTSTVTSYWMPDKIGSSDNESGTGISLVWFDKLGYERIWIYISALSAGNVTIEASGC